MLRKVSFVLAIIFLLSFISAGNSSMGVEYDNELIGQFALSKWVYVTVDIKDFSDVTIDYENDSVEVQTQKDNQRWETYRQTSSDVLETLSSEEFQLKSKSEWGRSFSGNITKEGFDKLLQDERVRKIYAEKEFRLDSATAIKSFFVYIVPFVLIIVLTILLIKWRNKKWKIKN